MKSREANIRVAEMKAEGISGLIDSQRKRLTEATQRVAQLHASLSKDRVRQHGEFIQSLDSHALRLVEEIYPKEIQSKFSFSSTPFWAEVVEHAVRTAENRNSTLDEGFDDGKELVNAFISERENETARVREFFEIDTKNVDMYELEFVFAEIKDTETGNISIDILFPWEVSDDSDAPHYSSAMIEEAARIVDAIELDKPGSAHIDIEDVISSVDEFISLDDHETGRLRSDLESVRSNIVGSAT
ncbi:hypothetical protein JYU04_03995 [Dehalococcoides mccartyi]|nr:hypothetical protein [Dehalococcoides mccartyi]